MEDTSLSESCTHVLIKNLGHLARQASCQSYCGGNTDLTHPASLFCADQHYRFPLDHGAVQKMKDNCVPASFGKGSKVSLIPSLSSVLLSCMEIVCS